MKTKTYGWVKVPLLGSEEKFETEFSEKMHELCGFLDDDQWKVSLTTITDYYVIYILEKNI